MNINIGELWIGKNSKERFLIILISEHVNNEFEDRTIVSFRSIKNNEIMCDSLSSFIFGHTKEEF